MSACLVMPAQASSPEGTSGPFVPCTATSVVAVWRVPIDAHHSREEVVIELRNQRRITVSGSLSIEAARSLRAKLWLEAQR